MARASHSGAGGKQIRRRLYQNRLCIWGRPYQGLLDIPGRGSSSPCGGRTWQLGLESVLPILDQQGVVGSSIRASGQPFSLNL